MRCIRRLDPTIKRIYALNTILDYYQDLPVIAAGFQGVPKIDY